jgi:uroporphyrinogen III methyltransferase/synthase
MNIGKVYLVGAGPGDPGLITVKGLRAIRRSDVIVYDRLASPLLLHAAKADVEKVYVGKLPDRHTMKQEEINQLLVDLAKQGKIVTRLKGGDPSVFGRVGEEAGLLADNGVPFEIVPGITSAISVPTYAGIPVTHRDHNTSFTVVTGHEKPEKLESTIQWDKLATGSETLLFLMGVARIGYIAEKLIAHGRDPETPVALIRWGTRPEQQTLIGKLYTIAEQVQQANFQPPAIIVIGDVVNLRDQLQWYESMPLFGKRVLITRASSQSSGLSELIFDAGGEALELPVIKITEPSAEMLSEFDAALRNLAAFKWVFFTSINGVEKFFARMRTLQIDIRQLAKCKLAAVGPKTAEALREKGLYPVQLQSNFDQASLFAHVKGDIAVGDAVLLARADIAAATLPTLLRESGAVVTDVSVYQTVADSQHAAEIVAWLEENGLHIITFTSSSTVHHLWQMLEQYGKQPAQVLANVALASIGPITTQTLAEYGLQATYEAEEATIESLVASMIRGGAKA